MTYTPNIPQGSDNISVSQGQILTNFTQIGALFGSNLTADHFAFDDGTAAKRGHHRMVEFYEPLAAGDPTVSGAIGTFYTKADPNDTSSRSQVYYRNVTEIQQVTNRFHNPIANKGYWILPGGTASNPALIFMWGVETTAGSTTKAVTFPSIANYTGSPAGFPNNVFNVQLTTSLGAGDTAAKSAAVQSGSLTQTGFTIQMSSSAIGSVYWFAIGN